MAEADLGRQSTLVPMPLLDAAARADVEAVRAALQSGADVNASDPEGLTSVACAIAGRR